jgi:probable HAF family extracellular repeat protein
MPTAASRSVQFFSGAFASRSKLAICRLLALSALVWWFPTTTHAQAQASCTFTLFPIFLPHIDIFPSGINDFGTVVGVKLITPEKGFIRWANGGLTFPHGTTSLANRNDSGVSIGYSGTQKAIILSGSSVTPITLATRLKTYKFLNVNGINDWGSIVGYYTGPDVVSHGFKRWRNGSGFTLDYPAHFHEVNSGTFPTAINNKGMIVGFTQIPYHGFVYYHGMWANLEYPGANATDPRGISDAGVIVGNSSSPDGSATAFLYQNGVFKAISVPNTTGSYVVASSLRKGLILGIAYSDSVVGGQEAFIAQCH